MRNYNRNNKNRNNVISRSKTNLKQQKIAKKSNQKNL